MNGLVSISGVIVLLVVAGSAIGLLGPGRFSLRWLLVAAGLVLLNDVLLTRGYGLLPELLPDGDWNWQGKILALACTLLVASHPAFGWRRSRLTLSQAPGSLKASLPILLLYVAFFAAIGWMFPSEPASGETIAFQLTMPGFEEEPFYRGILLFALGRAFLGRATFLGVEWGWGAVLSCILFGLAHALSFSDGRFAFDPLTMALTAIPSFIAVWLVLRTRSVLVPVVLHNLGNSITLLI